MTPWSLSRDNATASVAKEKRSSKKGGRDSPGNETGLDTDIHEVEDVDVETDFDVDDVEDPTEDAFEKRELGEEGVFDVEEDGLDVHDKLEQEIDELVL